MSSGSAILPEENVWSYLRPPKLERVEWDEWPDQCFLFCDATFPYADGSARLVFTVMSSSTSFAEWTKVAEN